MGNRAVITTAPFRLDQIGIYVHWHGGPESVTAFLRAAKRLGMRSPAEDPSYAMARLTQVIANLLGGSLSIGIGVVKDLDFDNGDNGTYLIGGDWQIVGMEYGRMSREVDEEKSKGIEDKAVQMTELLSGG